MNSLLIVFLLLAFFCGSTEFNYEHSISVHSESVACPEEFGLKNFTAVNCARGVSTHLTWEMKFNPTFYKPLVLVSETVKWNAVKGQFCVRVVESILRMRVNSV